MVFIVKLLFMIFFLVYSIYAFRGKQPRSLMTYALTRAEGFFFLYDCYVFYHYGRSKYNYQKMFYI